MATGQKISAMTSATNFSGSDELVIVQSGTNKSLTHDVLMDDTQICQAWVNFDGTGTPTIRDSYNVSSITDNGTGDYTINIDNNLANTNYCMLATGEQPNVGGGNYSIGENNGRPRTTGTVSVLNQISSGGEYDPVYASVSIFGGNT